MDWMCEKTGRDPTDYCYKRTELFLSPYVWAKTIGIQGFPVGQKKTLGPHTIERLERVGCRVRVIAVPNEWYPNLKCPSCRATAFSDAIE